MDRSGDKHDQTWTSIYGGYAFPALLAGIGLAFFGDVLFFSSTRVMSKFGNDLSSYFIYLRDFGFSQLLNGNLPLWNPHVYSGSPYVGGLQSALFYPPTWIYFILPFQKALNAELAIHVLGAGVFMYLWCAYRGLHRFACLTGGVLFMFSGAFFTHLYAGHLAPLAAMTWTPLIVLAADGLMDRPGPRWCALGIFALSMQVLAGYPQIVFFTGVATAVYVFFHLALRRCGARSLAWMAAMCAAAFCICAVQLFSGFEFGAESVRSDGLSLAEASIFSFAPENFLTLAAPGFFGIDDPVPYWGRCYFWEMCLYFGVVGLVLTVCGVLYGPKNLRRFSLSAAVICLLLALGAHTPLYGFLFSHIPGFGMFRGQSKYVVAASVFLIMLAAVGLDSLIRGNGVRYKRAAGASLLFSMILAAGAMMLRSGAAAGSDGFWAGFLSWVGSSGEIYMPGIDHSEPGFISQSALNASKGLLLSSAFMALGSVVFFISERRKNFVHLLGVLAMVEILVFAWGVRPAWDIKDARVPALASFAHENKGDYRVLNMAMPNSGVVHGMYDIWGYDPGMSLRYAEFMSLTQGSDPDKASYGVRIKTYHDLLRMLRCKYIITREENDFNIRDCGKVWPRARLFYDYEIISDRDRIFSAMTGKEFNPDKTVVLESGPGLEPSPDGSGTIRIVHISTDQMLIDVETNEPAILVVSDVYSRGWKASPADPESGAQYKIMPANYVLRGIPLKKGAHSIVMEFKPTLFVYGKWLTCVSLCMYAFFLFLAFFRRPEAMGN